MSSLNRKYRRGSDGTALLAVLVGLLLGVPVLLWLVLEAGAAVSPRATALPSNIWERGLSTVTGRIPWRAAETGVVIAAAVAVVVLVALLAYRHRKKAAKRVLHDRAARHMANAVGMKVFTRKAAAKTAQRLKVENWKEHPGLFIGKLVRGGQEMFASWEDTLLHIWGSRTGKTTTQAAPSIVEAPGPVLATSNKPDLVELTQEMRARQGQVWVFDPQGIANEPARFWWNPLTYVTDSERAAEMAGNFALGSRDVGAKGGDAFFDSAGKDLLAGLLLAAAVGHKPISRVHFWLTRPLDEEPIRLLDAAGWKQEADSVAGAVQAPEKQREGVFGVARQMATCLKNEKIQAWVNPPAEGEDRPEFDPATFVRGSNALYAMSKEGAGTAGPLVTSLTVATVTAAEEYAIEQGGRLGLPLVCVLDEAANVCRWQNLPDLYSHYGSRGIILSTFLQSWSQGVDVWGESGMKKLFSTANVFTYGGNVKEREFLATLVDLIGKYNYVSMSSSRQKDSASTSRQDANDDILSVADLVAWPKGRALMLGSGTRGAMVKTVRIQDRSWWGQQDAEVEKEIPAATRNGESTAPAGGQAVEEEAEDTTPAAEPVASEPSSTNRWASMLKE